MQANRVFLFLVCFSPMIFCADVDPVDLLTSSVDSFSPFQVTSSVDSFSSFQVDLLTSSIDSFSPFQDAEQKEAAAAESIGLEVEPKAFLAMENEQREKVLGIGKLQLGMLERAINAFGDLVYDDPVRVEDAVNMEEGVARAQDEAAIVHLQQQNANVYEVEAKLYRERVMGGGYAQVYSNVRATAQLKALLPIKKEDALLLKMQAIMKFGALGVLDDVKKVLETPDKSKYYGRSLEETVFEVGFCADFEAQSERQRLRETSEEESVWFMCTKELFARERARKKVYYLANLLKGYRTEEEASETQGRVFEVAEENACQGIVFEWLKTRANQRQELEDVSFFRSKILEKLERAERLKKKRPRSEESDKEEEDEQQQTRAARKLADNENRLHFGERVLSFFDNPKSWTVEDPEANNQAKLMAQLGTKEEAMAYVNDMRGQVDFLKNCYKMIEATGRYKLV